MTLGQWIFVAPLLVSSMAVAGESRSWTDQTGTVKKTAEFERLDGKWVHLRLADGEAFKVPLEWLSEADQAFAKEAASRVAMKPKGSGAIEVVIAEGVGVDVESAREDAYRNAVRQAVGAYVDSETIVANDQLITDKVITLSPGFVERVEPISGGEAREGSLIRIRVRAHVRITKLLDALAAGKIKTRAHAVKVDTESILAELRTKADQREGQRDVLARILADYPEACLSLTVSGKPSITTAPDGKQSLAVPLSLKPNDERYLAFSEQLCTVLSATERPSGEFTVDAARPGADTDQVRTSLANARQQAFTWKGPLDLFPQTEQAAIRTSCAADGTSPIVGIGPMIYLWNGDSRNEGLRSLETGDWRVLRANKPNDWVVICVTKRDKDWRRTTWRWFVLSEAEATTWFGGRAREIDCRTALVDGSKQELAADSLRLTNFGARRLDHRLLFLVPAFVGLDYPNWFTPELTFVRSIAIDDDDVAAIAEVRATVERVAPGPR
jgi:hypothetical protein